MDPKATLRIIINASADNDERQEACENLTRWIERGGWSPIVVTHSGLVVDVTGAHWSEGRFCLDAIGADGDPVELDVADVAEVL